MNVAVTTEVGYCPFCQRSRNLRRENRHLGGLVRTTVECESCHRTLSSTLGPPPPAVEATPAPVTQPEIAEPVTAQAAKPKAAPATKAAPAKKAAPARKAVGAKKAAATTRRKPAASAKSAAKKK